MTAKNDVIRRVPWSISVRPDLMAAVKRIADEENNSSSRIVERAIRQYLDARGAAPAADTDPDTTT